MTIVFAENFQNDTPASLVRRYPGTAYSGAAPAVENAYRLMVGGSYLQIGKVPFTDANTRFEVRLDFPEQSVGNSDRITTLNVFGLSLRILKDADGIEVSGYNIGSFPSAKSLNLIVDRTETGYSVMVLVDNAVVLTPTPMDDWSPNSWIGIADLSGGSYSGSLPLLISSIVVAVDTPAGTRLGPPATIERELTLVDSGEWQYSNDGYVDDVNVDDPTKEVPNVNTDTVDTISYEIDGEVADTYTQMYAGGYTEAHGYAIQVNDDLVTVGSEAQASIIRGVSNKRLDVSVIKTSAPSNSHGVIFYGESEPISYASLVSAVGLTDGTPNPGPDGINKWLEFSLDGKRLFIAKVGVVLEISWNQLYAAGLVYGTPGPGTYASSEGAVSQNKTVVIDGKTYIVRLPKGADTDPCLNLSGSDPVGTYNSEWSRLFAPIVQTEFPSYSGPKFAMYTPTELGMFEEGTVGFSSWCQETNVEYNNRLLRGNGSTISYATGSSPVTYLRHIWRPILELIE